MRTDEPVHKTVYTTIVGKRTLDSICDNISSRLPSIYWDKEVEEFFKQVILPKCHKVDIEYPYIDTDYLSTYYSYYAKHFSDYRKECCRIVLYSKDGKQKSVCAGFVTLRPLLHSSKIGKTYLDPKVFLDEESYVLCGNFKIHHKGAEEAISAMPYSSEQRGLCLCGHVSIWSILRFFSSRFSRCPAYSMGDVIDAISSPTERKIPTHGLTPTQVATFFTQAGYACAILRRESLASEEAPFEEQLVAYLDSGIPVLCISEKKRHAVVACGRNLIDPTIFLEDDVQMFAERQESNEKDEVPLYLESGFISQIIVNDNLRPPYSSISLGTKEHAKDVNIGKEKGILTLAQVNYCIVPLDNEMTLPYSAAKDIAQALYRRKDENGHSQYRWRDGVEQGGPSLHIMKMQLVSSNTFKEWIRTSIDAGDVPASMKVLLQIAYPRFLWLAEFSSPEEYSNGRCSGFIALDASCLPGDSSACIVIVDKDSCEISTPMTGENGRETLKRNICNTDVSGESVKIASVSLPLFRKNYKEVN